VDSKFNMPSNSGRRALDIVRHKKAINKYIAANKKEIRALYWRVAKVTVSRKRLENMANGIPKALAQLQAMQQADAYRVVRESFYGEKRPYKVKKFKNKEAQIRQNIRTALKFYGGLAKKFDTPAELGDYLDARKNINEAIAKNPNLKQYGERNLIKAEQGIKGYEGLKAKADYLQELDPVIQKFLGRQANIGDVNSIMPRFASAQQYAGYLGMGVAAGNIYKQIKTDDLADYGAGDITKTGLQEELYRTEGRGGDLQRRIQEARIRRKNLWSSGVSRAETSKTKSGLLTQELF